MVVVVVLARKNQQLRFLKILNFFPSSPIAITPSARLFSASLSFSLLFSFAYFIFCIIFQRAICSMLAILVKCNHEIENYITLAFLSFGFIFNIFIFTLILFCNYF